VERVAIEVPGLDEVLHGGLLPGRAYLVRGGPGTGKTTLGLHFLAAGVRRGERSLYVTLGEPAQQIKTNAQSIGLDPEGIDWLELIPTAEFFAQAESYDLFTPAEVEREPMTRRIVETIERTRPQRVFVDSMTQFRYLAPDIFQYRRQVLSFLRFLTEQGATVLFASESSAEAPDEDLQFLADGVIELLATEEQRSVIVTKFRGSDYRPGRHTVALTGSGMKVFPALVAEPRPAPAVVEQISSGVPEVDELLHGGLERGTVTIITGPSGVGKTTLGLAFAKEAAGRGEASAVYVFEEPATTLQQRCEAVNIPVGPMIKNGTLVIRSVEPLRYDPNEFAQLVREDVQRRNVRIVMIDSVAGYGLSVRGNNLASHIHTLCRTLANWGVTVLLVNETESVTGDFRPTERGISYLADSIIFLRYLEIDGEMRKAIGVLKKRLGDFEKTLREFRITRYGIKVGEPLTRLRGILSGTPTWEPSAANEKET